jgi:transposase
MALNEKQVLVLQCLSLGMKAKDAAKKVGVTPETISTWNRSYEFRAERNRLRAEAIEGTRDTLRWAGRAAAETLVELAAPGHPAMVRLRAAVHLLQLVREDSDKVGGYTVQDVKYDDQYEKLRKYPEI